MGKRKGKKLTKRAELRKEKRPLSYGLPKPLFIFAVKEKE